MNKMEVIKEKWNHILEDMLKKDSFQQVLNGKINKELWGYIMVESGHLARFNPQIQAYASMFFKGEQEKMVKSFLRHAISEIGHDELAYSDAEKCGVPLEHIREASPMPETIALTGLPLYLIQFNSPLCYLGYLFFLEFLPTSMGEDFLKVVMSCGVEFEATTFLRDHAEIDLGHNKLMESYIDKLVKSEAELNLVIETIEITSVLYENMISAAINNYHRYN